MQKLFIMLLVLGSLSAVAQDDSGLPTYKHVKNLTDIPVDSKFDKCVAQVLYSMGNLKGEIILGKKKKDSVNFDYVIVPIKMDNLGSPELYDAYRRLQDDDTCPKFE
jgi:hypothetical protein